MTQKNGMNDVVSKVMTMIFLKRAIESTNFDPLDEIIPGLYLGNAEQAMNPRVIHQYKITHIVNACQSENVFEKGVEHAIAGLKLKTDPPNLEDLINEFKIPQYKRVNIPDNPDADITIHLEQVVAFVNDARSQEHSRVLFHCHAGISRSSTLLIAYLMESENIPLDEAFQKVALVRKKIRPNPGFCIQLINHHQKLFNTMEGTEVFIKKHGLVL
ncbi:Serine/threonine/tyrosine-interacting-like protein 1 [Boothiomyces sp. JEL0838]|nr:Serine/threonine/tyrosine-interacting-like protein 1 [Boothiomyces sp. JEL0838]